MQPTGDSTLLLQNQGDFSVPEVKVLPANTGLYPQNQGDFSADSFSAFSQRQKSGPVRIRVLERDNSLSFSTLSEVQCSALAAADPDFDPCQIQTFQRTFLECCLIEVHPDAPPPDPVPRGEDAYLKVHPNEVAPILHRDPVNSANLKGRIYDRQCAESRSAPSFQTKRKAPMEMEDLDSQLAQIHADNKRQKQLSGLSSQDMQELQAFRQRDLERAQAQASLSSQQPCNDLDAFVTQAVSKAIAQIQEGTINNQGQTEVTTLSKTLGPPPGFYTPNYELAMSKHRQYHQQQQIAAVCPEFSQSRFQPIPLPTVEEQGNLGEIKVENTPTVIQSLRNRSEQRAKIMRSFMERTDRDPSVRWTTPSAPELETVPSDLENEEDLDDGAYIVRPPKCLGLPTTRELHEHMQKLCYAKVVKPKSVVASTVRLNEQAYNELCTWSNQVTESEAEVLGVVQDKGKLLPA